MRGYCEEIIDNIDENIEVFYVNTDQHTRTVKQKELFEMGENVI